jgi:hypothetical protein
VLEKLIDANGNATSWDLDVAGRVVQENRANASYTAFIFENTTSRLKRRTNAKGEHTDYTYFKDNNINAISYPNAGNATSTVSHTYDSVYNRVATMVDGIGTTTYSYNAVTTGTGTLGAAMVASIDGPFSNDTIAYGYDELGRGVSRSINSVSSSQTYDLLGRVDAVTNALGSFSYTYVDETARPATVGYPSGQTTEFAYFNNAGDRRLQQIHHKLSGGATLSKFDYAYNTVGKISTWTQQRDSGGSAVTRAYDFNYDRSDQLTFADYRTTGGSPTLLARYAYTYDSGGNRTSEQIDDAVYQAGYDNMNRLTSRTPGGPLHFAGTLNEAAAVTVQGKTAEVASGNQFNATVPVASGTSSITIAAKDYSGNTRTSTYDVTQSGPRQVTPMTQMVTSPATARAALNGMLRIACSRLRTAHTAASLPTTGRVVACASSRKTTAQQPATLPISGAAWKSARNATRLERQQTSVFFHRVKSKDRVTTFTHETTSGVLGK